MMIRNVPITRESGLLYAHPSCVIEREVNGACQLCAEPPYSIDTELCERHHFDYLDWMRFETNYVNPQMSHVAEYLEAMR